jgi:hypothetical protein
MYTCTTCFVTHILQALTAGNNEQLAKKRRRIKEGDVHDWKVSLIRFLKKKCRTFFVPAERFASRRYHGNDVFARQERVFRMQGRLGDYERQAAAVKDRGQGQEARLV